MDILNRFDLNLLVVFEAIYSEGGVSKAADRLCLTQSAVSHALRRLREILNDPLFSREGNQMIPNGAAEQLIGPVRLALDTVKTSLGNLYSFDPASSTKHFRIGVRGPAESTVVPPIFSAMRRAAPHTSLGAVFHNSSSIEGLLKSRAIDLAIDIHQSGYEAIESEGLGRASFVVMLRPNHPAYAPALDLEKYMQLEHIVISTRRSGLGLEDAVLRGRIRGRKVVLQCQDYGTAAATVIASDAAVTVPRNIAMALAEQTPLTITELFPNLQFKYAMYWNAENTSDPSVTWFRSVVRECAGHSRGMH
jgi:DNA-binding transcriptional LysR family regulator